MVAVTGVRTDHAASLASEVSSGIINTFSSQVIQPLELETYFARQMKSEVLSKVYLLLSVLF